MKKTNKYFFFVLLSLASVLFAANAHAAVTSSTPATGASYLLAGSLSGQTINATAGNGIPGPQSAISVPEPSSWFFFAFGVMMIGGAAWVTRRRSASIRRID